MATRARVYEFSLNCQFCGGIFSASRYDAKYCCAAHRLEAKRKRDRLANEMIGLRYQIDGFVNEFVRGYQSADRSAALVELGALKIHLENIINAWDV